MRSLGITMKSGPCSLKLEKALAKATKTQCGQKKFYYIQSNITYYFEEKGTTENGMDSPFSVNFLSSYNILKS